MRVGDRLDLRGPSAVRFEGTDRTEFFDNRQFHGNAFGFEDRCLAWLAA